MHRIAFGSTAPPTPVVDPAAVPTGRSFNDLPVELAADVLRQLDTSTLVTARRTSRRFAAVIQGDQQLRSAIATALSGAIATVLADPWKALDDTPAWKLRSIIQAMNEEQFVSMMQVAIDESASAYPGPPWFRSARLAGVLLASGRPDRKQARTIARLIDHARMDKRSSTTSAHGQRSSRMASAVVGMVNARARAVDYLPLFNLLRGVWPTLRAFAKLPRYSDLALRVEDHFFLSRDGRAGEDEMPASVSAIIDSPPYG